jgi:hypothetical protein
MGNKLTLSLGLTLFLLIILTFIFLGSKDTTYQDLASDFDLLAEESLDLNAEVIVAAQLMNIEYNQQDFSEESSYDTLHTYDLRFQGLEKETTFTAYSYDEIDLPIEQDNCYKFDLVLANGNLLTMGPTNGMFEADSLNDFEEISC